MAPLILRLTSKGQITLPRRLRERLGVQPGDAIALTPTPDGVLITATGVPAPRADDAGLKQLMLKVEAELAADGITEEEQLDPMIKEAKRKAFEEIYGRSPYRSTSTLP